MKFLFDNLSNVYHIGMKKGGTIRNLLYSEAPPSALTINKHEQSTPYSADFR